MLSLLTVTSLLLLPISSLAALAASTCPPNLNTAGINLVKEFEGWRASPYKDPVGKWTVAYGHLCDQKQKCSELKYKFPMTKTEGQSLLQKDLEVTLIFSLARLSCILKMISRPTRSALARQSAKHPPSTPTNTQPWSRGRTTWVAAICKSRR